MNIKFVNMGRFNIIYADTTRPMSGVGVTARDFFDICGKMDGLLERIKGTDGKIAFVGNGFSNAPLITQQYTKSEIYTIDAIDYHQAYNSLKKFGSRYFIQLKVIEALFHKTKVIQYYFGDKNPPVYNLDLIVNSYGPVTGFDEQLSMLKPCGEIFTNYKFQGLLNGFIVKSKKDFSRIKRIY